MHFKRGVLALAVFLAGCGSDEPTELICPAGMSKTVKFGLEQCVAKGESGQAHAGQTSPSDVIVIKESTSDISVEQSDFVREDSSVAVEQVTLNEVGRNESVGVHASSSNVESSSKRVAVGIDDADEVIEEEIVATSPLQKADATNLSPVRGGATPPKADQEQEVLAHAGPGAEGDSTVAVGITTEQILERYASRLKKLDDLEDADLKLTPDELNDLLIAELEKVDFNDAQKTLEALDEGSPLPWEVEDSDEDVVNPVNERELSLEVARGDSLLGILSKNGISTNFYYGLASSEQKRLTRISIGDKLSIKEEDGTLYYLSREISPLRTLVLERIGDKYEVDIQVTDPEIRQSLYTLTLSRSLYLDGQSAGLSDNVIANLQEVFSEKLDFSRDVRRGDSIQVLLNEPVLNGALVGKPSIAGAKIVRAGRDDLYAIRFETSSNGVRYYNDKGESLQTGFIRKPTIVSRISSNFNPKRLHPVTGRVAPHLGTDMAAPTGTPIYAASDGQVVRAGWGSGYGNVVYIDHGKGIQTRYAHMSKISTRRGRRVSRGDVIGYVGATGRVTGPHLHYEYRVNGVAKDPMKVSLPTSESVPASDRDSFDEIARTILQKMEA